MKRFFSFFAAILFAGVWMVQAATYTVAGGSDVAFGTAWAPANEANDMTLVEGLYQWEKTDLTLPAGTIEFKVCEDHAWTIAYPSQNYQLAIPEAGIYSITITFNADSKEVKAVATKTSSAVVVPSIAMHGNFLGSWADTENFTVVEGNETAVLTLNLVAGSYEFGMRIGGSGNWTSNGAAFTRENPSAVVVAGQGNLTLAADKEGTYTFTWTYETNTLAVTFPEKGDDPQPVEMTAIYDWAGEIGTTILGASGVEVTTVKIHTNTDAVPAIKFGSSYVYADGKWLAIKPAEGGFKAGDVVSVAVVFNNSDDTKYVQVDLRAANGDTRIWLSEAAAGINGRTSATDPIVQKYTLEADQDSLFLGRYGNTAMFVTLLKVERAGGDTPEPPTPGTVYYLKNNWNEGEWAWKAMTQDGETYKLESVIFGGNGVNYNTAESDEGATWVPADQILGDKIAAKDTVTFVLDPVAKTVTATLVSAGGDTPEPPTPGTVYYMKNNWGAGADWTWKAMTQDGETYKLESVIFGGNGVNYNTAESDEGATWVPADQILGDKIAAKDTVTFVLDPAAKTVTATLVGKYQEGGDPEPPTPGEHTYTVAGSSADAFGTAWTPSIEANDMTLTEGLYQWKKTDLTLPAGTIEFKVCEDHAWTNCWPSQNYQLAIPEAGIYTITITFNAGTKEVNAVATKTGSAVVVPSIAMHGNFTGSWVDTEKFTVAEGNATASLTLNLAAGNYEFGVRINGTWTSNGVAFARANPSAVVVAGQGNLTLAADKEGTYTFTWTYETNTLTITFPTTTALDNTAAQEKATKILRNGQIFIIKGDKMYNVMGAVIR